MKLKMMFVPDTVRDQARKIEFLEAENKHLRNTIAVLKDKIRLQRERKMTFVFEFDDPDVSFNPREIVTNKNSNSEE